MQDIAVNNSFLDALPLISPASNPCSLSAETELRTSRLLLRRISAQDFNDYLALFSDPVVMRFIGVKAGCVPTYEEIVQLHQGAIKSWEKRGYGRWSLFDRKSNEFAGFCGFRAENDTPELIAALHERFWARGLAAEAASACLNYGFETLGFKKVKAFTRPHHARARRVLQKLEAEFEGYINFHGVPGAAYNLDAGNYLETRQF